jgi:hypothetical protein
VAKVFATLRVTGHVSDGVARDLLAQLRSFTDACDAVGVEVKQSVDVTGLEPEPPPVVVPVVAEPEPDVQAPVKAEEPEKPAVVEKADARKSGKGAK